MEELEAMLTTNLQEEGGVGDGMSVMHQEGKKIVKTTRVFLLLLLLVLFSSPAKHSSSGEASGLADSATSAGSATVEDEDAADMSLSCAPCPSL